MTDNTIVAYKDRVAFHPGFYMNELRRYYDFTIEEFCEVTGIDELTYQQLSMGNIDMTKEIAEKMSSCLGTSVRFLLHLQIQYKMMVEGIEREKNKRWYERDDVND